MMQIAVTKKMAKELKKDIQDADTVELPDIYRWHMNLFKIGNRKCVLLMNDATGLNLTLLGLKKEQFENIDQVIMGSLRELLKLLNVKQEIIDHMLDAGSELIYTNTHNRSVLGMMNEISYYIEAQIEGKSYDDIDAVDMNEQNNGFLLKGEIPIEKFKQHFEE
ncbi:DUF6933 domain-containing protein [Thalassobacillus hwangdonensis]|uniref:DUF6933 domain-containing protein n=1 Tax=Thalassobacillus hwangdonensis TaxID=546108 RepID=A0ABW3L1G7_9BACI